MHYTLVPYLGVTCPEPRHNQLAVFLRIPFITLNLTHEGLSFLQDIFKNFDVDYFKSFLDFL